MPKKPLNLFSFWNELKRRKVARAVFVYVAAAWAIMEASDTIFPRLGLPDWTVTFVLILLIIVFVLVVILTWVYDITPEGIKVTQDLKEKISEEKEKITDKKLPDTAKPAAGEADKKELEKRIEALEEELKEARKASIRSLWPVFVKKIGVPVLIVALLIVLVLNKQKIADLMGIGDAKREVARTHNYNATVLINNENYEAARSEVELALESDPEYSYAWSNMAVISFKRGDIERAVSEVLKAVSLDPSNSRAPYNLAYLMDDRKDVNQAIHWYKKAISIDSLYKADTVYTAASSALGRLYNSIGQPAEAIIVLSRALDLYPESPYICYVYKNIGNSYLLQNMNDTALKYLELSYNINPDEKETNLFLAKAYEADGQLNKSIEFWQKYIEMEIDTAKANEAVRHWKELAKMYYQEISK